MKNIVYQLLDTATAERSEAIAAPLPTVVSQIKSLVPVEHHDRFAVIVLVDDVSSDFQFSRCPVLSVSQFLKLEVVSNG